MSGAALLCLPPPKAQHPTWPQKNSCSVMIISQIVFFSSSASSSLSLVMLSVLHTLTDNKFVGLEVRRRLKKAAHVGRKVGQCHPHCHCFLVVILLLSFCSPSCQTLDLSSLCHCPWHHSHFILIFNLSNLYQLIILSRVEKGRPALFSLSLLPSSLIVLMLNFSHLSGKGVM